MASQEIQPDVRISGGEQAGRALFPKPSDQYESHGRRQQGAQDNNSDWMARGLGWFSLGLGLAAVVAPRQLGEMIGIGNEDESRAVLRAVGLREIVTGVGILAQPESAGWLAARVGGDVMDLALLGSALTSDQANRPRVAAASAAVVGIMALDLRCCAQLRQRPKTSQKHLPRDRSMRVQKSVTVNRSPEELYRFWHDFENLPRFMTHLETVQVTGERQSHWKAKALAGMTVAWDAEIIADRPNELIGWRSLAGSDVDHAGSVRFKRVPGGRGTEVRVEMQYIPPGGVIGATIAKLLGKNPSQQMQEDLRRFKQLMEAGEMVQSEAIARGRGPARPLSTPVSS